MRSVPWVINLNRWDNDSVSNRLPSFSHSYLQITVLYPVYTTKHAHRAQQLARDPSVTGWSAATRRTTHRNEFWSTSANRCNTFPVFDIWRKVWFLLFLFYNLGEELGQSTKKSDGPKTCNDSARIRTSFDRKYLELKIMIQFANEYNTFPFLLLFQCLRKFTIFRYTMSSLSFHTFCCELSAKSASERNF